MQFEMIRSMFVHVDKLIKERNQKINYFMDVLHYLDKDRIKMIEDCYKRYMIDINYLPGDAFQRLYEKYLKVN